MLELAVRFFLTNQIKPEVPPNDGAQPSRARHNSLLAASDSERYRIDHRGIHSRPLNLTGHLSLCVHWLQTFRLAEPKHRPTELPLPWPDPCLLISALRSQVSVLPSGYLRLRLRFISLPASSLSRRSHAKADAPCCKPCLQTCDVRLRGSKRLSGHY